MRLLFLLMLTAGASAGCSSRCEDEVVSDRGLCQTRCLTAESEAQQACASTLADCEAGCSDNDCVETCRETRAQCDAARIETRNTCDATCEDEAEAGFDAC